jgi:sec-independent protein translocase protein TatB
MVILVIALIVIGPEQMPLVLRTVAKIIRELRAVTNEAMRELTEALDEQEASPKPRPKLPPPQSAQLPQPPPASQASEPPDSPARS